ncbi:MAG: septum formation initiator family protein [Firmicutes bacterium]|nr:septum formation initiator family protein [Bacillota bacterium]
MAQDYFKEDILQNAISNRQRERREAREAQRAKKEQQERKSAEAALRAKRRRRMLAITVLVLIVVAVIFGQSVLRIMELRRQKAAAQRQLDILRERLEQLEDELARVQTDEYIEQQARTHLRMIFPGETVYILVPAEPKEE